jgi:hypothetical protein
MNAETVARTIQFIIAPVVMVTACALILGGLLGRYAVINDRLRALARERLEMWQKFGGSFPAEMATVDALAVERLQEIDMQIPDLLRRHKWTRDAVLSVYGAVIVFITTMFVIAAAAVANSDLIAALVLILFLCGTALLLCGVLLTAREVRHSRHAVEYEVERIAALGRKTN